jgi:proline dehydrogenase
MHWTNIMITRTILLKLADSPSMRGLVEKRGWRFASRFVAGTTLEQAVAVAKTLNAAGITATLSHLGEHITDADRARAEVSVFQEALETLNHENVRCGLSLKPSQLGMFIDPAMAAEAIRTVTACAAENGRFVRVDMEDSDWTDATLKLVHTVHAQHPNIGVVIQSYLRRSQADVEALNGARISVRLCKGAYNEPASVAFPTKMEVDARYVALSRLLLEQGNRPAFATHDPKMISAIRRKAVERPDAPWEVQMLYGVRRDLQTSLAAEGHNVRVYVPFGTEWYPYFTRRLAERPANIGFILRNLFKG